MPATNVVWVTGTPRSGSSFLSVFLGQCGCDSAVKYPLVDAKWNSQFNECAMLLNIGVRLLGTDNWGVGLWNPMRPATMDPETVAELQNYLAERVASANGTYLLKANWAPYALPEMLAAFPQGTTHKFLVSSRASLATYASLAKVTGVSLAVAKTYIDAHLLGMQQMVATLTSQGIPVRQVDFDAVQKSSRAVLQQHLTAIGLTAKETAWTVYDPSKVTF